MHHHLERGKQLPELVMHLAREPPALVLDAAVEAVRGRLDLAERPLQLNGADPKIPESVPEAYHAVLDDVHGE